MNRPQLRGLPSRLVQCIASAVALGNVQRTAADVTQCTQDTFGLAGSVSEPPFEYGVEKLSCNFEYQNVSDIPQFILNYYPSIQHFADYNGTDLNPERHWEYPFTTYARHRELCKPWVQGKNGPKYQTERIRLGECSISQPDGGGYIIQRVGPLVSTGNYDYWQFGWHDVWHTSRLLKEIKGGIAFSSSFSGPVDPEGMAIGHPPIHIHHIHISPEPGVAPKMDVAGCMRGKPESCYVANLIIEQHGDYQCFDEDGGIDCFFEKVPPGYEKVIDKPLDLEGEINDVRAPDSEPMTWWYQVVLHWHPRKRTSLLRPLSQHFIVGPGKMNPKDQRHNVAVFPVRSQKHSVYWYTGRMDRDGVLARNKLHSHNTMFDRAFWFAATPAELGLDAPGFMPEVSYVPRLLHKVGFETVEDLQRYILARLAESAKRYDEECTPPGRCAWKRPALVCQSWVSNMDFVDPVSGKAFAYDRRAPACCRRWRFHKGDQFTAVSFMAPMKTPAGPWKPDTIPAIANMHIHWLMTYDSLDNVSHYSTAMYSQNPDTTLNFGDGSDPNVFPIIPLAFIHLFNNQGSLQEPHVGALNRLPTWYEYAMVATLVWMKRQYFYPRTIVAILVPILFTFSFCFYRACRASLRRRRSTLAMACAKQVPCCPEGAMMVAQTATRCSDAAEHSD